MSTPSLLPPIQTESSRDTEIAVAVFRTIFLLVILFSPQFSRAHGVRGGLFIGFVIVVACYNLILFLVHVRGHYFPRPIIVLVDNMIISLWIYFCGPAGELFFVLYYPVVVIAGLWFSIGGAFAAAFFASIMYLLAITSAPALTGGESIELTAIILQVIFLIITAGVVSIAARVQETERQSLNISRTALQQHWQRIRIAQQVDHLVRPKRLPTIPGLDLALRFRPAATAVSGDYYDIIPLGERLWGMCVADVCAKYEIAVRYLYPFRTAFRFAARREQLPARVLAEVNQLVAAELSPDSFISMCYVVIDLDRGLLTYAIAGNEPPVLVPSSGEGVVSLSPAGIVLGVMPDAVYQQESIQLHTRDLLVLFTDGLTEVTDSNGHLLGREGLITRIETSATASSADAVANRIFEEVNQFGKGGQRRDDMTLLVVRVTAADLGAGEVRPTRITAIHRLGGYDRL